jgi:putative DNA primase/helicase
MAERNPIDYAGLAAALLARAPALVAEWLPYGFRKGRYWYVGDFDGSEGKSANVNLETGAWGDNGGRATGDAGKDLTSLYRRVRGHATMHDAAVELLRDNGWEQLPKEPPKPARTRKPGVEWLPQHPVPDSAPPYKTQWGHYARGVPDAHWEYRDRQGRLLGVVCRFNASDGSKEVQPLSWCHGSGGQRQWRYKAFAGPRPLYGLWRLADVPAGQRQRVIVLEGEKKSDALYEALGRAVPVLSWPGGCKVPQMADWQPLAGCDVLCWPDADSQLDKKTHQLLPRASQPGWLAMRKVQGILRALDCAVNLVDVGEPGTRPDGWDAGDAVAAGWKVQQLQDFMAQLAPDVDAADAVADATPPGGNGPPDIGAPGDDPPPDDEGPAEGPPRDVGAAPGRKGDAADKWRAQYVWQRGNPRECVPNVMLVLSQHKDWQGVLGFDRFSQRVVKRKPAPYDAPGEDVGEWSDVDDTRTAAWIARREGWVPSSSMVAEAATEVAHGNSFHPVLDWLDTLKHDGIERVDTWLVDFLHWPDTPYARKVSRYFLIGMCMRVLHPGVKFDYCLVLEGPQGRRKSSSLRALGGEWFSDTELDLTNKDAMSNIRGKWLHEFGEMGSLARSESNRQKSFLSRQVDEFRPTYGRREIRCPRQLAFAGSTNEWQWNKDPTGGRRFWPGEVGDLIDVEALTAMREQLFAEAYALAKAGERYWPDAEEQRELFDPEQLSREQPDGFVELLGVWMDSTDPAAQGEFTLSAACMSGLNLDAKAMTKDVQTRVGIALRKLGCTRVERRNSVNRFVYQRPERNAALSQPAEGAPNGVEVPF